jgi:hypothetical protein
MVRLCDVDDVAWPMGDGIGAEAEGCRGGKRRMGIISTSRARERATSAFEPTRIRTCAVSSRFSGAKFAYIQRLRHVRFQIPDRDAAEGKVEMFISHIDGRMSRILTIGAAQLGPTQRRRDRASLVQRLRDLWVILHD